MEIVAGISQGFAALANIMIVIALSIFLRPSRNPRMRPPEGCFDQFVTYFINRGVCVTIVQLAYMCVFVAMPSQQIWILFHLIVSKLYVNTLLAMLNSREVAHGRGINEEESVASLRKGSGMTTSSDGTRSGAPVRFNVMDSKVQSINIEVSHSVDMDQPGDKAHFDDYPTDGSAQSDLGDGLKDGYLTPEAV